MVEDARLPGGDLDQHIVISLPIDDGGAGKVVVANAKGKAFATPFGDPMPGKSYPLAKLDTAVPAKLVAAAKKAGAAYETIEYLTFSADYNDGKPGWGVYFRGDRPHMTFDAAGTPVS